MTQYYAFFHFSITRFGAFKGVYRLSAGGNCLRVGLTTRPTHHLFFSLSPSETVAPSYSVCWWWKTPVGACNMYVMYSMCSAAQCSAVQLACPASAFHHLTQVQMMMFLPMRLLHYPQTFQGSDSVAIRLVKDENYLSLRPVRSFFFPLQQVILPGLDLRGARLLLPLYVGPQLQTSETCFAAI